MNVTQAIYANDGRRAIEKTKRPPQRLWKRRSVEKSKSRLFHLAWKSRNNRGIPTFHTASTAAGNVWWTYWLRPKPTKMAPFITGADTLTINRGMQFCKLSPAEQLEQFVRDSTERTTGKVIRQSLSRPSDQRSSAYVVKVLEALRQQEARQPGLITIRLSTRNHSVVLIGRDLFSQPHSQEELKVP